MTEMETYPTIGFGTYRNKGEQCSQAVATALEAGYRHVDTARAYENETAVGEGIRRAPVAREEIDVASKVWLDNLGRDDVVDSVQRSVEALEVESLDIVYVHWPAITYRPEATFGALEQLRSDGLVDRIGAANFTVAKLERAIEVMETTLDVVQVELHPLLPQPALRSFAEEHGIDVVAHTPLMAGEADGVPELASIADKHDTTAAQVSLAWLQDLDVLPIPGSGDLDHIRENFASTDLQLDETDREKIDAIERRNRVVDPVFAPW